jgi:AcrR family transcriptional regulator
MTLGGVGIGLAPSSTPVGRTYMHPFTSSARTPASGSPQRSTSTAVPVSNARLYASRRKGDNGRNPWWVVSSSHIPREGGANTTGAVDRAVLVMPRTIMVTVFCCQCDIMTSRQGYATMLPRGALSRTMSETASRPYSSPLRERHTQQTRDLILDAATELLESRRIDEVTTREIAQSAGVSERTVYRHFPDRDALLTGLTTRLLSSLGDRQDPMNPRIETIDELKAAVIRLMGGLEEFHVAARAEALFNADPRRFSPDTRANSEHFPIVIAAILPELAERDCLRLAAVIRCLLSAQAWLRMREEFGIDGDESGPIVAWVLDAIVNEIHRGNLPP